MGAVTAQTVDTSKRLEALRTLMAKPENNVTAMVIPSEDQRTSSMPWSYNASADSRMVNT